MPMKHSSNIIALIGAISMVMSAPVRADGAMEAIVVSAPGDLLGDDEATLFNADDLRRGGDEGIAAALASQGANVSVSDAQGNPYQSNLFYRGFVVSPLQGTAQGLAVYVDGMRFNQPFGDTVNFDLLPDGAIESVSIRNASPVYGFNALGGALVVETKTGRTAPGVVMEMSGGDHGQLLGSVDAGWAERDRSAFVAMEARHDDGWRRHSPSTLYNFFGDLGWDGDDAGVHLKATFADTDLTGNGAAPVELLAAAPDAVFTYPDNTVNRYGRVSVHPWKALGEHTQVGGSLAFQVLRQRTLNGDLADIAPCDADDSLLCLETAGGQTPLRDAQGAAVPNVLGDGAYGVLNRGSTYSRTMSTLVQVADSRPTRVGTNKLIAGFGFDRGMTRFASSSELGALTTERSVTGLGPIVAQADGVIAPVSLDVTTQYTGLFLSDRFSLRNGFSTEVGLRWNQARIRLRDRQGSTLTGSHDYERLNPGIELGYRTSTPLAFRAGYSEANRAPTPAELSCADASAPCSLTNFFVGDPPLHQVVSHNWLLGVSGDVEQGWRGQWTLSAYRSVNDNDIQYTASTARGRAYFRNIGQTRRQGIEASFDVSRARWSIRIGYAFIDAVFLTPLVLNSSDNPAADSDGRIAVEPGDRIPSIPRHRGTLSIGYKTQTFALGTDVQAQSGQYFAGDEGNDRAPIPGFAIVNLHGRISLQSHITLLAAVTNLFDRRYATFGTFAETSAITLTEAPGASDPRSLSPGAPRRWQLGIRYAF